MPALTRDTSSVAYRPILAIETSCDETSAAVIIDGKVASNIAATQLVHSAYGGVVPELASRAHLQSLSEVVRQALAQAGVEMTDINGIAVTAFPGLIGSLVVGVNFAKGLALRYGIPVAAVNHIEGHIYSAFLERTELPFPFIALVVSGGHTSLFLVKSFSEYETVGSTRDDAAGEAFDKIAKLLGLGYPGGAQIDSAARHGDPQKVQFPRGLMHKAAFDFSFSGLKTSVRYFLAKNYSNGIPPDVVPDICASAQAAIVDVLITKTLRAATHYGVKWIVVAGGVSANSQLRKEMRARADREGISVAIPSLEYCTDNAAMIGLVGRQKLMNGHADDLTFTVQAVPVRAKRKLSAKRNRDGND